MGMHEQHSVRPRTEGQRLLSSCLPTVSLEPEKKSVFQAEFVQENSALNQRIGWEICLLKVTRASRPTPQNCCD